MNQPINFKEYLFIGEFLSFEDIYDRIISINPRLPLRFNLYIWIREDGNYMSYAVTINSGYNPNNMRTSLIINLNEVYSKSNLLMMKCNPTDLLELGFNKRYERTLKKGHEEITYADE